MEMEMDKFLAKKQQINHTHAIHQTPHDQKHSLLLTIIHILLKSLYENIRQHSFSLHGFQQLQTDLYFLYQSIQSLITQDESHHNLINGLFNEVMSCAMNRSKEFQSMDEAVLETIAGHKMQKLNEAQTDADQ